MTESQSVAVTIESLLVSGAIKAHKDGNHGSQYPRVEEFGSAGVPFLTAKLLSDGNINIEAAPRLADERANKLRLGFVQPGDVLLSHNATIGRVAIVPTFSGRLLIGTSLTYFRLDESRISPRYLAAFFVGEYFQNQLKAVMSHTTRNQVPITAQRRLSVVLPPIDVQRAIAAVLGALDDRIALLRETNTTLEAIAQALFKSWFVDFDPVRAKQQGLAPAGMDEATAALFPDSFEDSPLGPVPQGWQQTNLAGLTKHYGGGIQTGPFGSQLHASDYVKSGIPVVMPKDIQNRRATTDSIARIRAADADRLSRHKLTKGDIVFSRRGDVERHALISEREVGWLCGTGCLLVRPGEGWPSATFLSMLLDAPHARTWLVQHAVGATMPNINTGILGSVPVIAPPPGLLTAFEGIVALTEEQRSRNASTGETLATLRDTLLPRLISGQLRLPEAHAMVEEVA